MVDALNEALSKTEPSLIKTQTLKYAPKDTLKLIAAANVRDEHVFPTPAVLEAKPTLVGYYRLLLGASQKSFYRSGTGMGLFKAMEMAGTLNERQRAALPDFCAAMSQALAELVRQLSPSVTPRDVSELRLLTLGSQFQGANNVTIGKQATADVFLAIADILKAFVTERTERKLVVRNSAGRRVVIALASDPDVRIQVEDGQTLRNKLAIEIKGGTDNSNAHNRAGEAEKSHQKARKLDFRDCWTVIAMKGLDAAKLKAESPTTNSWFDIAQVLGRAGHDWSEFRSRLADAVGVPV
ncbi:MAG TPA: XcyI family restriction endonuclease [Tepidisphaeraceae bacterium]